MKKEIAWSVLLPAMACTTGCIFAPVFGAPFWIALFPGVILPVCGAFATSRLMVLACASRNWPTTSGKVLSSRMRKRIKFRNAQDSNATYSEPEVRYEFKVNGHNYSGGCVSFGSAPTTPQQNRYRQGSSVTIFYKPNKPSISVLQPGNPARLLPGLMALLGLAVVFAIAAVMLYKLKT